MEVPFLFLAISEVPSTIRYKVKLRYEKNKVNPQGVMSV